MSNTPRQLTRNQLADFLPNARAVRAFEQLLKQVGSLLPSDIETINRLIQETSIEASSGVSKAQEALDLLSSISRSLEMLAKAPQERANNSLSTDYLDFNTNPRFSAKPGRMHWGSTGTLEIEMGGGNITQQVGEEFFAYGKATAAVSEGQLIMVTGAVGASGVITFAPTSIGITDPNAILGIATENIALNGFGRVTTMGVVHGINTTGSSVGEVWADGDVLWYNTSAVGSMTKVKPIAPNMKTQVAIVINAGSGSSGSLQVEVIHGSMLGGTDTNVQLGALADKQILQYDAVAGYWKNVASTASGLVAAETHAAASKAPPVDADEIPVADSAASFSLKKLTWANLKAALKTYFDTLYQAVGTYVTPTTLNNGTLPASVTTLGASGLSSFTGASSNSAASAGTLAVRGGQVGFPATQVASTDPNTLDDYEEGTWTPSDLSGAGLTFSTATGHYTKVGRLVTASFDVTYPVTASVNNARVSLPFTSVAGDGNSGAYITLTNVGTPFTCITVGAALQFYDSGLTPKTNANFSLKIIRGVATYFT